MTVGLKDGIKLVGVAVIVCAAVLVSTLFLNYLCLAGERRAELDILLDGQMRQQIILLKHEPDLFPSELGKLFICVMPRA